MNNIIRRFRRAHLRLRRRAKPCIALVTLPVPGYDFPTFNLGLAELAGYLRHRDPELSEGIHFIEPDIALGRTKKLRESGAATLGELRRLKPHIIGLSAKMGSQDNLRKLLAGIKAEPWAKDSVVIVGNVVSTFFCDELAAGHRDVVFAIGDGELTLDAVYQAVKTGDIRLEDIPNIAFWTEDGVKSTPRRRLDIRKAFWLPALDMLDTAILRKADIVLRASAGCSGRCVFCSSHVINRVTDAGGTRVAGWSAYPAERTAELFRIMQARGVDYINLGDDEFGNDFVFIETLAGLLIAQDNRIRFNVSMRMDAWWTPDMAEKQITARRRVLKKLMRAGLSQLFIGAESGAVTQLKRFGKGYDMRVNTEVLKVLVEDGVFPSLGFVTFDHFINRYELAANLAYLKQDIRGRPVYEFVSSPMNLMKAQRGTPYAALLENRGLLDDLNRDISGCRASFVDPRMGRIAELSQIWFREIIGDRYPVLQLYRMSDRSARFPSGTHERARGLVSRMHRLDVEYMRALSNVFPEDAFDRAFGTEASRIFLKGSSELGTAIRSWKKTVADRSAELQRVTAKFKRRRAAIQTGMKSLLKAAYKKAAKRDQD